MDWRLAEARNSFWAKVRVWTGWTSRAIDRRHVTWTCEGVARHLRTVRTAVTFPWMSLRFSVLSACLRSLLRRLVTN